MFVANYDLFFHRKTQFSWNYWGFSSSFYLVTSLYQSVFEVVDYKVDRNMILLARLRSSTRHDDVSILL